MRKRYPVKNISMPTGKGGAGQGGNSKTVYQINKDTGEIVGIYSSGLNCYERNMDKFNSPASAHIAIKNNKVFDGYFFIYKEVYDFQKKFAE